MNNVGTPLEIPISVEVIENLRKLGYVVVPLIPNKNMLAVGAPSCFSPAEGAWNTAIADAALCYRSMIEVGCL